MPKFQQRHYEAIANVLDSLGNQPTHMQIVDAFATMLGQDNSKFKASLFYFAAGEPEQAADIKAHVNRLSACQLVCL